MKHKLTKVAGYLYTLILIWEDSQWNKQINKNFYKIKKKVTLQINVSCKVQFTYDVGNEILEV